MSFLCKSSFFNKRPSSVGLIFKVNKNTEHRLSVQDIQALTLSFGKSCFLIWVIHVQWECLNIFVRFWNSGSHRRQSTFSLFPWWRSLRCRLQYPGYCVLSFVTPYKADRCEARAFFTRSEDGLYKPCRIDVFPFNDCMSITVGVSGKDHRFSSRHSVKKRGLVI